MKNVARCHRGVDLWQLAEKTEIEEEARRQTASYWARGLICSAFIVNNIAFRYVDGKLLLHDII